MAVILTNTGVQFPSGTTQTDPFVNGSVTAAKMGYTGALLQTTGGHKEIYEDYSLGSSANNPSGFTATGANHSITTVKANSVIYVSVVCQNGYSSTAQHYYLDIQRSINGGAYTSLASTVANADALAGRHVDWGNTALGGSTGFMHFVDTPNVAAGTTLTYRVSVGKYNPATETVRYGYHNGNGAQITTITIMEFQS